jgi:L-aspartate oxidase
MLKENMKPKNYDILIAGSGIAGLYAALCLEPRFRILMLSKKELTACNSAMAQGGIAAALDRQNDCTDLHFQDTLSAGGQINNSENLRILVEQGPDDVENLQRLGVSFDENADGSLSLALEGGHSRKRVAHHKDSTGHEIVTALTRHVRERSNVTLLENAHLLDLTKQKNGFSACIFRGDEHEFYSASICILATGGIGRVYDYTTNSPTATGDGIYFAHKLGAQIKDLSYIQFHPTAFAKSGASANNSRECFLMTEAMRGEGAYLLNHKKERFMQRYEPERMELAPRDVVSKCILAEQERTGSDEFFLDISHVDAEFVKSRFPTIYARILSCGFDITAEPVPIYPCQHYLMGGIAASGEGATSVANLYAVGECSYTGVHGTNRLASNSLLEALVFSRRTAEAINASGASPAAESRQTPSQGEIYSDSGLRREIRKIMQKAYFITPDYAEIRAGLTRINEIQNALQDEKYALTPELVEVRSLAAVAFLVLSDLIKKEAQS